MKANDTSPAISKIARGNVDEMLQRLFDERGDGAKSTVVITMNDKEDPDEWLAYERDRAEEAKVKARFRDGEDSLSFLIVTAKLLTASTHRSRV